MDSELILNCHSCGDNFDYPGLQSHISSVHGRDHVKECEFCSVILKNSSVIPTDIPDSVQEHLPIEVFLPLPNESSPASYKSNYDSEDDDYGDDGSPETNIKEKPSPVRRKSHEKTQNLETSLNTTTVEAKSEVVPTKDKPCDQLPEKELSDSNSIVNPFSCRICENIFFKRSTINRHLSVQHGIDLSNGALLNSLIDYPESEKLDTNDNAEPMESEKAMDPETPVECLNSEQLLIMDILNDTNLKIFTCPLCSKSFSRKFSFRRHLLGTHPKAIPESLIRKRFRKRNGQENMKEFSIDDLKIEGNMFVCPVCKRKFSRKSNARRHLGIHGPVVSKSDVAFNDFVVTNEDSSDVMKLLESRKSTDPLSCPICKRSFSRIFGLKRHYKGVHNVNIPQRVLRTTEASKTETIAEEETQDAAISNSPSTNAQKLFKCLFCGLKTMHMSIYQKHMKDAHQLTYNPGTPSRARAAGRAEERQLKCKICGGIYSNRGTLRTHLNEHIVITCRKCLSIFESEDQLAMHEWERVEKHGMKDCETYPCVKCPEKFSSKCEMECHFFKHFMFRCSKCGQEFLSKVELEEHDKVHNDGAGYPCDKCDEVLETKALLRRHQKHAHSTPQLCNICGILATDMTMHRRKHQKKAYRFKCYFPDCGKMFKERSCLLAHRSTHSDDRPHVCDIGECRMAFRTRNAWTAHRKTHNSEKKFKCHFENCDRSFHQSFDLNLHIRRHTGEKPFICNGCEERFYTASLLKSHKQNCPLSIDTVDKDKVQLV